ncbi:MAG: IS66 family transposase [Planctomycetota bacterium]
MTKKKTRTGLFTTRIVSQYEDHQIAVFFTGRQHAGENLTDVLRQRARALEPPIHVSDGLARNTPKELETLMAYCMTHARRYFVDVAEMFPDGSRHVVDALTVIYENDAIAREQGFRRRSGCSSIKPTAARAWTLFQSWLNRQFEERLVEPNSGLGKAITYMLNHWPKLTLTRRDRRRTVLRRGRPKRR